MKKGAKSNPWEGVLLGLRDIVPEEEFSEPCLNLKDTPTRIRHAYEQMLSGYKEEEELKFTIFQRKTVHPKQMVVQSDISFTSVCAHHLLPFRGRAAVGYLPMEHEVGLSKLSRVVDMFSKRLQTQERLGDNIADFLMNHPDLSPAGVGVILEAEHMCMTCRGVLKAEAKTRTSSLRGLFFTDSGVRSEFLLLRT